jgi:hypothetical protein
MRYSLGDKALSDDQYRRVLVSRWLAEQNVNFDPSIVHRFFPPGAPLPAAASFDLYRKDFEAWMGSMGPLAPSKLRVKVDFTDKVSTDRLPSQCNEMEWTHRYLENGWRLARSLFGDEGEALLDSQLRHIGDSTDDKPAVVENFLLGFPRAALVECEIDATKDIFYSMFEGSMPQSAYLIVDKLPAPNFLSNSPYNAAMLDLAVTNVEMVQVADGPAVMVVRATLESAEWQATSINQNQLVVNDRRSFSRESLEPEQLGLDLLGIRLGISENEADQLVRAYMAEPMVLKSVVDFSPNTPAFSDTTVYVSADGHEGIALIYEAGTGERRVLGVTRKIYAPGWGLSRTDVTASVLKKYGQPAFEEVSEYSSILAWGPGSGGRYCREVDSGWRVLDNWVNETGQTGRIPDFMDWGEARSSGVVALPEPNWNDELVRCEGLVLLRHDENRVTTTLIDPAAYYKAWQGSLQMAQELIDKKVDEGGAPVIAF